MIRKLLLVFFVLVLGLASSARSQAVANLDVGNPSLSGSASYDPDADAWTVSGAGADIWGSLDQFHYVFRPLAGDGEGIVRVASMDITHDWAKVGVMIRETLDGDSKYAMVSLTGANGIQTSWRLETGGGSDGAASAGVSAPWWIRIERIGDTINTYLSPNGLITWIPHQVLSLPMSTNVYIGMFVCSHQAGQLCTTVFDNVSLTAPEYTAAWLPSPADGSVDMPLDTKLSWMAGDTAATHDVYFGTTDPPEFAVNQAETSYDPGVLNAGTTYYWQVDEVEADGITKHAGSVQSFTTIAAGPGKVKREWWLNIGGVLVDDLRADARYPDNPDGSDFVDNFEGPSDWADNYGTRLSGYLHAPVTGDYTFWIAADDGCQLWLSTTDAPADAVLIAYHNAWSGSRQWDMYPEQKSEPVALTAGQLYYIEALMKEGGGGDNVSVGWQIPGLSRELLTGAYVGVTPSLPLKAYAALPPSGATLMALDTTLSWLAGETAASHDVYFGTTDPPKFVGNQTETGYDPGPLAEGTVYYWQVDEVEADGVTKHTGDVMSFKTTRLGVGSITREVWEGIGGTAVTDLTNNANYPYNPTWSDELTSINVTDFADNFGSRMHGWLYPETSGDYTFWIAADDNCALWLSTSENPVDAVRIAYHNAWTGSQSWDVYAEQKSAPVSLEGGMKYYISALYKEGGGGDNCAVAWEGPDNPTRSVIDGYYLMPFMNLWAYKPSPADGATVVGLTPTLSWEPAVDAASYDVYFDGELLANTTETSVAVGPLLLGSTHTWQVDVVTNSPVRTGAVWSFTIADHLVIDDFNIYDIQPVEPPGQSKVVIVPTAPDPAGLVAHYEFAADAKDSSGNDRNGTLMGDASIVAGKLVLDGDGDYVNIDGYKGINAVDGVTPAFSIACWFKTTGGGEMVTWGTNVGGQRLTFRVSGGRLRTEHGSGNLQGDTACNDGEWHLAILSVPAGAPCDDPQTVLYLDGVNDNRVNTGSQNLYNLVPDVNVAIGMGGPTGGRFFTGSLDDVRIYDYALSQAEAMGLASLTDTLTSYRPLLAHYEFEDDYSDSSGNGRDGTPVGEISFDTDPIMGQVLSLPGGDDQFVDCGSVGIKGRMPRTIACWAKADHTNIPDWTLIFGFTGMEDGSGGNGSHFNIGSIGGPGGVGAHCWGWEETILSDQESLDWHHYTMTYDGTTIRYYADGAYKDTDPGKSNVRDLVHADRVHIGSRITQASSFPGKVEDARIYDYALSEAEIASLAGVVPTTVITDNWSDWGFVDLILDAGTMKVDAAGLPGLPYFLGEVSRIVPFADLTAGGGRALSIWFRGNEGNVAEYMYAALSDGAGNSAVVLYDGDAADLSKAEWKEWNIDMKEFAGVDITNADELAIGLAGLDGSADDALNFDDIRVYMCRCMPDILKPYADLNRDCRVDLDDVQLLADSWGNTSESWFSQDVGNPIAGSDGYDSATGTFSITANGHDIWDNADDFRYVYKQIEGDGEIVARVVSIGGPSENEWRKAGVMIRETLTGPSKHAYSAMTAGASHATSFQRRTDTGGGSASDHDVQPPDYPGLPYWVKLVRSGDTFSAYYSADGSAWVQQGGDITIDMPDIVYIGLAVTSHETSQLTTCELDNVSITGNLVPVELLTDLNNDGTVGWQDLFVMLDEWLDERLWPEW